MKYYKRFRLRCSCSNGFSLVEVIVAMALFAIVASVFLMGFTSAFKGTIMSGTKTGAIYNVASISESLLRTPFTSDTGIETYLDDLGCIEASDTTDLLEPESTNVIKYWISASSSFTIGSSTNTGYEVTLVQLKDDTTTKQVVFVPAN